MRNETELLKKEIETLKNESEKKSIEVSNNTELNDEIKQLRESCKKIYEKKLIWKRKNLKIAESIKIGSQTN